jgi:hypothetical protein
MLAAIRFPPRQTPQLKTNLPQGLDVVKELSCHAGKNEIKGKEEC